LYFFSLLRNHQKWGGERATERKWNISLTRQTVYSSKRMRRLYNTRKLRFFYKKIFFPLRCACYCKWTFEIVVIWDANCFVIGQPDLPTNEKKLTDVIYSAKHGRKRSCSIICIKWNKKK
jgi:hypothetical protein